MSKPPLPPPTYSVGSEPSSDVSQEVVVGPADHLVLVSKSNITQGELRRMVDRLPESLRGRVLVVDGTTLDVKVIRPAEAEWEPMCQCGGPKNHCVGPR